MESKHKHLEFIQEVISRMSRHSFVLKGWGVTLVAALLALAAKEADIRLIAVSFIPVLIFWLLDSYYIQRERLFRALYDKVRTKEDSDIDFSMAVDEFKIGKNVRWRCFFSGTLLVFYFPLLMLMLIIINFFR